MNQPVYLLICLLVIVLALPIVANEYSAYIECKYRARSTANAELLAVAMTQYAGDHNDRWPDAAHWGAELKPYVQPRASDPPFDFTIPSHPGDRLAMNIRLSGAREDSVINPDSVPLLYEVRSNKINAFGTPPWLAYYGSGPSDTKWRMIVFADGYFTTCSDHAMAGGKMR